MSEVTRAKIYSFAPFHSARGTLRFRRFTPHPHLTAIIWNFPAENSQISLRETSDKPDVKFNKI